MSKIKKRMIALDADYLIFKITESKVENNSMFAEEDGFSESNEYKKSLKPYKDRLKQEIQDVEDHIAVNLIGEVKGIKPFFSDPDGNFRYDLEPDYKGNRKGSKRSELFYRLRKWAHKKYGYVKNMEADDVVAHYVRKGWIGASFDKDLLKGQAGTWFDTYHTRCYIIETSEEDAQSFALLQTLAGDPTDNIKGIPRVGMKTAEKLLTTHGSTWEGVVAAYKGAGLTEEDAILNRRLVGMDQYHGKKKGLKLFTPPSIL